MLLLSPPFCTINPINYKFFTWKWTQTFTVRSQWLSYDIAGTHNVLYTNPQKNMGDIQSRPLGGQVYWPGNWACSTVYTDTQNTGMTNSITVLLQAFTVQQNITCCVIHHWRLGCSSLLESPNMSSSNPRFLSQIRCISHIKSPMSK